jgi:hypothetical protein
MGPAKRRYLSLGPSSGAGHRRRHPLGALGIVCPAQNVMQVVIGPQAEIVAGEIRDALTAEEYAGITAVVGKPLAAVEGVETMAVAAKLDCR